MKRKVKLFATIACLCLSLALMAFGVYAATQSTLNVTSKVTFVAEDVYVDYTAALYRGADQSAVTELYGTEYTGSSYTKAGEVLTPNETDAHVVKLGESADGWSKAEDGNVLSSAKRACKIEITVKNIGKDAVKVEVSDTTGDGTNMTKLAAVGTGAEGASNTGIATLAQGATYTFYRIAYITDITTGADLTWTVGVTVTRADA